MSKLLLNSPLAEKLYTQYAKDMPIFDYHSHVSAEEIYRDRHYSNITQLWLEHDHYKWRLMRMCGVSEDYITGERSDREKFLKFCEIIGRCVGNPVYTWTYMELEKYFGYTGVLNSDTAEQVWDICSQKLSEEDFGVRKIILGSNVKFVGTTNSPCEDLEYHKKLMNEGLPYKVCPTFRPDEYLNIDKEEFPRAVERLALASGMAIDSERTLRCALRKRMNYFSACGCISADHGCDYIRYVETDERSIDRIFKKALDGASLCEDEIDAYKTYMLLFCTRQYAELSWVMQIHYNCIRNPNSLGFKNIGADGGFDCILRHESSRDISMLLDKMVLQKAPKLILYSLDENENRYLDTLAGSFACGEPYGRIVHGASWWFNDTRLGIENHIKSMACLGVLGNFLGMTTDSRSFLSYSRHDYFRRILCSQIAQFSESGENRESFDNIGKTVSDICYGNTKKFFEES